MLRKTPPGVSAAALLMACWCKLGLAPAVGQCGSRGPSSPSKLGPAWEQTEDKKPLKQGRSLGAAASTKTQPGLEKQETIETAKGTWQPFDSKQKRSVTFTVKEKQISQK